VATLKSVLPKFKVGDKVNVGHAYDNAVIVRLVSPKKIKGQFMYQVEYTTDKGTAHERRHQQPWLENNIQAA
jgi:hypothetical protein